MRTAYEVQAAQRAVEPHMWQMQEVYHDAVVRSLMQSTYCYAVLGFCKRNNLSPKPLARLKQSLCDLTINNLAHWSI